MTDEKPSTYSLTHYLYTVTYLQRKKPKGPISFQHHQARILNPYIPCKLSLHQINNNYSRHSRVDEDLNPSSSRLAYLVSRALVHILHVQFFWRLSKNALPFFPLILPILPEERENINSSPVRRCIMKFTALTLLFLAVPVTARVKGRSTKKNAELEQENDRRLSKGKKSSTPVVFTALLSAAQEPTFCDSTALGNALVTYDKYGHEFCFALSFQGLVGGPDSVSLTHLHGPGAIGEDDPLAINIGEMLPDTLTAPSKACVYLDKDLEKDLYDGLLYFNIHTSFCATGELRGQILPVV